MVRGCKSSLTIASPHAAHVVSQDGVQGFVVSSDGGVKSLQQCDAEVLPQMANPLSYFTDEPSFASALDIVLSAACTSDPAVWSAVQAQMALFDSTGAAPSLTLLFVQLLHVQCMKAANFMLKCWPGVQCFVKSSTRLPALLSLAAGKDNIVFGQTSLLEDRAQLIVSVFGPLLSFACFLRVTKRALVLWCYQSVKLMKYCRIPAIQHVVCSFQTSGMVEVQVSGTRAAVDAELSLALTSYGEAWVKPPEPAKKAAKPAKASKKTDASAPAAVVAEAPAAAPVPPLKASINYVPMNESCTEESCAGRVVVLDAIDDYAGRMREAVAQGCRGILLTVHNPQLFALFQLHTFSSTQKSELAVDESEVFSDVAPVPAARPFMFQAASGGNGASMFPVGGSLARTEADLRSSPLFSPTSPTYDDDEESYDEDEDEDSDDDEEVMPAVKAPAPPKPAFGAKKPAAPKPAAKPKKKQLSLPVGYQRLPVPVMCIPEAAAVKIRAALNIPRDLDPTVLVPVMNMKRLRELGHSEELCAKALERSDNDYETAAEWLASNAKFFAEQSSMMAELDALVVERAKEKRKAPAPVTGAVPTTASAASAARATEAVPAKRDVVPAESDAPLALAPASEGKHEEVVDDGKESKDDAPSAVPLPANVYPSVLDLIRQDECWPLATRWQAAIPNTVLVVSDRYDMSYVDGDEARDTTATKSMWLSSTEALTIDSYSPAALLKEWVAIQDTLACHYARRALIS